MHETEGTTTRRAVFRAVLAGALLTALLVATGALGAPERATATLDLAATLNPQWRFGNYCEAQAAPGVECVRFVGTAAVPGLGVATTTYTKTLGEPICGDQPVLQFRRAVLEVAGKGSIQVAMDGPVCGPTAPAEVALDGTVLGGDGLYADATGSVRFESAVYAGNPACGPCGTARDRWTGTLTVPGLDFDTTPPILSGTASKTVRATRSAKRVRVRFTVTARDTVDTTVPVTCSPRSGSWFPIGGTAVTCSAIDSSGNEAKSRFRVTVKQART